MRALRATLFVESPDAGDRLANACIEAIRAKLPAGVVASYVAMGGEIDPKPLSTRLVSEGWREALPRADTRHSPLCFLESGGATSLDAFGVPAPLGTAHALIPTLVIVPLLAFDVGGGRLGQGAGAYDRTIARLRRAGPITVAGAAFAGQRMEHLPCEAHDERLDLILTDQGVIDVIEARP